MIKINHNLLSEKELEILLGPDNQADGQTLKLRVVLEFPLEIAVRVGKTFKTIGDLLELAAGMVIELDRGIGEPVDLIINGQVVAKGEVVVIGENFGVRITSILKPMERLEPLR